MFQYVEKAVDEFSLRWNNYKMGNKYFQNGPGCMQQHLFEHFFREGHCSFSEDVTPTLIDQVDSKGPKQWGRSCRHSLKTIAPLGLNVEDV